MKIKTSLPMKYDISRPGIHKSEKQNIFKVTISQAAKLKSLPKVNAANPALSPSLKQALNDEISYHRNSAHRTAKKIAKLDTWQDRMLKSIGVAAVGLTTLLIFAIDFPVAYIGSSGVSVLGVSTGPPVGYGVFLIISSLIWFGVWAVGGNGALLAGACLLSGILVTASVTAVCLQVAIWQQQIRLEGARKYADVLAAQMASHPDTAAQP